MGLIEQIYRPINRQSNREIKREADKINKSVGSLLEIEETFLGMLFENEQYSYNDLYKFYLAEFIEHCNYHINRLDLKYFKINKYYFKEQYQPLELCNK
jgi:hypothetical protein